jgi:chromosome segregation protein
VESDLARLRIALVEAEMRATGAREAAHARELAITRQQQQIAFDKEQEQLLNRRAATVAAELETLDARREPARAALAARRAAALDANGERDRAAAALAAESACYDVAHREIEGLEADVEAARSEVFSAINAATALRHSLEHAASARERVLETLSKLHIEFDDVRIDAERVEADRLAAADGLRRAQDAIEATRIARAARESELASARIEHEWRARSVRSREHELAGLDARLASLQEIEAARVEYGDAARTVLAQANGKVNQQGAVADYLEVEVGYERAVEGYLGDLLQHIVVERPEHAAAGFQVVREQGAGRCGFVITSAAMRAAAAEARPHMLATVQNPGDAGSPMRAAGPQNADGLRDAEFAGAGADGTNADASAASGGMVPDGLVALSSVVRVNGPFASAIRQVLGEAWIADSYERAAMTSGAIPLPVATMAGDVFRGPSRVTGGNPEAARGILETKREIKDLRARIEAEREALGRLAEETAGLEALIAQASAAIAALNAEHHRQEKSTVALEGLLQRASDETTKIAHRREQLARERRQAEDERNALEHRAAEARASIERLERDQRDADEALTDAQRRLFEARESTEELSRRAADAGAVHAALVERASALASEVRRLEESAAELESRSLALASELNETRRRTEVLRAAVLHGEAQLDEDVRTLEGLRSQVQAADESVSSLRIAADQLEAAIKDARQVLESIRGSVSELEIARATAESDLSHLSSACFDSVQATLDDVLAEVAELERDGNLTPDARIICAEEPDDTGDEGESLQAHVLHLRPEPAGESAVDGTTDGAGPATADAALAAAEQHALSAEEAITRLRARIERLGPVNMMAIDQFDELDTRHTFLTTQRKDLVDSIAQTSEAIKRIDQSMRQRFTEAFAAINRNFQGVFSTLFGGGRAGLTLLDENDPLESGIEIVAQPPGKRLQSVQLLSGGEKALTAISLMFGLFKYKPSPFCLLDEIDAPLDDANIGRFVEMLRSMQQHTQFILITHNRKTMEIADRLYGVTMEEPGVSKLISVQMN